MDDLTKQTGVGKVAEAAVEYIAGRRNEPAMSSISTKNQITLPAHLLRELGLRAGDRLAVTREGARLVLRARPKDWVAYHGGSLKGLYGKDGEEIDAYVKDLRADTEREDAIERAWTGNKPAPQQ
jgi:AbrB family looped-hinge helix DNA binding protein